MLSLLDAIVCIAFIILRCHARFLMKNYKIRITGIDRKWILIFRYTEANIFLQLITDLFATISDLRV